MKFNRPSINLLRLGEVAAVPTSDDKPKYRTMLSLHGARIGGRLESRELVNLCPLSVDLTLLRSGVLGGNLASGWGPWAKIQNKGWDALCLRLDGFQYDAIDIKPRPSDESSITSSQGIAWLARQWPDGSASESVNLYPYQQLAKAFSARGDLREAREVLIAGFKRDWWCRVHKLGIPKRLADAIGRRLSQPYKQSDEHVLRRLGKAFERILTPTGLIVTWLFEKLFGYGYSPMRAVGTLIAYWLAGGLLVLYGNSSGVGMFVIEASSMDAIAVAPALPAVTPGDRPTDQRAELRTVPAAEAPQNAYVVRPRVLADSAPVSNLEQTLISDSNSHLFRLKPLGALDKKQDKTGDIPCGDNIDPFVYAFDVMVPLLDLRQESRCSIMPADHFLTGETMWAWGKAIYAALGWILTSVGILTLSGVLRRELR